MRGISSLFIRAIVFNPVHNTMIDQRWNYIGNVDFTDKFWRATATGEYSNGDLQNTGQVPVMIICIGAVIGINYTNK